MKMQNNGGQVASWEEVTFLSVHMEQRIPGAQSSHRAMSTGQECWEGTLEVMLEPEGSTYEL